MNVAVDAANERKWESLFVSKPTGQPFPTGTFPSTREIRR